MLKQNAHIDELVEVHKRASPMPKSIEVKTKKEMKEKDKLINPKQIFEKTPKNTKSKSSYRFSDVDNKIKMMTLFEDRLS
jgi:hypothetical protein